MADTTTLDAITKVFYVNNKVVDQVHNKSILFDKTMKKRQTDVGGKNYTYALRHGRNKYAGRGISDGGDYGTVGSQQVVNAVVPNAEIVTPIELSSRIVNAADGAGKKAFIDAYQMEATNGMKDTVQALNRQIHSDGRDALFFWTGADDSSGTNVDDGQGNGFPVHLESGATTLDVIDASDNSTVLGNAIVVTKGAESSTAVAITWTGTVSGSADGDYAVMDNTLGKQMMGIRGIISASDPPLLAGGLHGLAVATYPNWVAQSNTNSGTNRTLTLELLQSPLTDIATRSGASDADIDLMLCNGKVRDKIIALLVADQRQVSPTKLKGGYMSIDFNGHPIVVDAQCRRNTMYYINTESLDFLTASGGLGWASYNGVGIWKQKIGTSGYAAAYQAFITVEGNMACNMRNANAVLGDLTDT